jgi:alpha/beta superfamily hydrolase
LNAQDFIWKSNNLPESYEVMNEAMTDAHFFPAIPTETNVSFLSSDDQQWQLEGRFARGDSNHAAIICHPHPLHGGTMQNKVVDAAVRGFASAGFSTLRFNFRGVGRSEGEYGNAVEEVHDIEGALRYMRRVSDADSVVVAGFSFGSSVVSRYLKSGGKADGAFLIAPPVDSMGVEVFPVPQRWGVHMVLGSEDEFCSPESFEAYQQRFETEVQGQIYDNVGHFFHGHLPKVVHAIHGMVSPA